MNKYILFGIITMMLMSTIGCMSTNDKKGSDILTEEEQKIFIEYFLTSNNKFRMIIERDQIWSWDSGEYMDIEWLIASHKPKRTSIQYDDIKQFEESNYFLENVVKKGYKLCYGVKTGLFYRMPYSSAENKAIPVYYCHIWILSDNFLKDDGSKVLCFDIEKEFYRYEIDQILKEEWREYYSKKRDENVLKEERYIREAMSHAGETYTVSLTYDANGTWISLSDDSWDIKDYPFRIYLYCGTPYHITLSEVNLEEFSTYGIMQPIDFWYCEECGWEGNYEEALLHEHPLTHYVLTNDRIYINGKLFSILHNGTWDKALPEIVIKKLNEYYCDYFEEEEEYS